MGAKAPCPPLGLITVAALLPQAWEFRLLDLNTRSFSQEDWDWAEVICVGGMLPQQKGILDIIKKARTHGKYFAVGGPDPSSQPHLYKDADALIVGEGESAIPIWLESWRNGEPRGLFREKEKPDITQSPVPRYDLLSFENYIQIGVQYSRGCPFNCEFCDIIELFGRRPRTKTPDQILAELETLYKLGYTGFVDIADDNFIANKRNVKRKLLPALIEWNKKKKNPFYFSAEASMNVADDAELLELMQAADFRVIFIGIETPDSNLLMMTQKTLNTMRPIVERVKTLYKYGMVVTAGFIMGFDGEEKDLDQRMIQLIEDCDINMAMVGLLVAMPNTQMTRRLIKQGRLLSFQGRLVRSKKEILSSARVEDSLLGVLDQRIAGLNFVTTRDRLEILGEYKNVVSTVYDAKRYFDRVLRVGKQLYMRSNHRPGLFEFKRSMRAVWRLSVQMTKNKNTRWLYWRNFLRFIPRRRHVLMQVTLLMALYLHYQKQTAYVLETLERERGNQKRLPREINVLQGTEPCKRESPHS